MIRLEVVKLKISSHASLSHDQARSSKVEDIITHDQVEARSSKVEDIITCLPLIMIRLEVVKLKISSHASLSHMIRLEVVKLKISSHASLSHDQARSSKVEDIITCLPSHMI